MITVNAMGDACPIPVVKTKNAIKTLTDGGVVQTLVDNEIAVQNLTKMALQKGYGVESEKLGEGRYQVTMTIGSAQTAAPAEAEEEQTFCQPDRRKNIVVVISSSAMGTGDDLLGEKLMKGFLYALGEQDVLPKTILFYNGGAKITGGDGAAIEDLKALEANGVEILTCGTCLDFYGLKENLKVGSVTNMYTICEKMTNADLIVKP